VRRLQPLAVVIVALGFSAPVRAGGDATVAGGLRALAFIAHARENPSPERFFEDYSRAVVEHTSRSDVLYVKNYQKRLLTYFERIARLEEFGRRDGGKLTITLSTSDSKARETTREVAQLLGWKTTTSGGELKLDIAERTTQSKRKETATALEVDEVAMQAALEAGRPFTFHIRYEQAALRIDQGRWLAEFFPNHKLTGGFAEALVRDPGLAKLYLALGSLQGKAAAVLLDAVGLRGLAAKHAGVVYLHGSGLAVSGGRALVPGGSNAETRWSRLAGADPGRPGPFFRALLEKDYGMLLAFYSTLSRLDLSTQRRLAAPESGLDKLYEKFRRVPQMPLAAGRATAVRPFIEWLRWSPADAGEPAAAATPDRALGFRGRRRTQAAPPEEGPIAAARIAAHREGKLSAEAAALLASNHADFGYAYPYLATLTGIDERDFGRFFALAGKLQRIPAVRLNTIMGQLHSLLALLSLAQENEVVDLRRAGELFRALVDRLGAAESDAEWTTASLELVRAMFPDKGAGIDETIRTQLVGAGAPVSFRLNGAERHLDPQAARQASYLKILALQAAPSIDALVRLDEAARKLAAGGGAPGQYLTLLGAESAKLPAVDVPVDLPPGRVRENLEYARPERITRLIAAHRTQTGPRDPTTLSAAIREALAKQTSLALAGVVYAWYLRPDDVLISEDPLFLRKHQFVPLDGQRHLFPRPALETGQIAGSHLAGGFADVATMSGQVAAASASQMEMPIAPLFTAQIGAIRGTSWRSLRPNDLRLVGLNVRLARERITAAATEPELRARLSEAMTGLLTPARRAELFDRMDAGDWKGVWSSVTLPELYHLAGRTSTREPRQPADRAPEHQLGGLLPEILGCSHPHLAAPAPYEEYAAQLFPTRIAQRAAEFKLYLAEYMERKGIPAAAMASLAEPLAQEILGDLMMTNPSDWRTVHEAFSRITDEQVEKALPRP